MQFARVVDGRSQASPTRRIETLRVRRIVFRRSRNSRSILTSGALIREIRYRARVHKKTYPPADRVRAPLSPRSFLPCKHIIRTRV